MKKFWLYWRWYALPLASLAGAFAALVSVVGARTVFDYARSLEAPTPQAIAALPIVRRTAETLMGAAFNAAVRLPVELKSEIPTLELVVDPEEFSLLGTRGAKTSGLEVDGEVKIADRWTKVKVKLRGDNIFHWGSELRSYTLEFGRSAPLHGQEQINLVNPKDAVAVSIPFGEHTARRLGVLTPDTQPCRLMLNGENQGVYFCQQPTNAAWLRLAHKPAGALYEGDYLIYGYGSNFSAARQFWDTPSLWKAETSEGETEVSRAALRSLLALWREIARAPATADARAYVRRLERIADVDAFLRLWATQTWSDSLHQDEYHNWRLYLDPSDGRFSPVVWDTLRVWQGTPEAALDAPLPRPQLALLRIPELNQRRYAILYEELIKPELEKAVSETWAREYFDHTRMTMLSAVGIDRMDWAPNALSWVNVSRVAALQDQATTIKRIQAHARGLAALLEATDVAERACAQEGPRLRCTMVLRSRAAVEPVAVMAGGVRRKLAAQFTAGRVALRPGEGAIARFYPQFVTAADEQFAGRWHARLADAVQVFTLEGFAAAAEVHVVWRNTLTGRETELTFPVGAPSPAAEAVNTYSLAAAPLVEAATAIRLGPGTVALTATLETAEGQPLEIAPGTRLRMGPGVSLIARGPLLVRGTQTHPVVIERLAPREAWGGVAVLGAAGAGSRIEGCRLDGGSVPRSDRFTGAGMLHIAHAPGVVLGDCELVASTVGDDALHINQATDVYMRDVAITQAEHDCVDFEHVTGRIERLKAAGCGDDALDLDDTIVDVRGASLGPAHGKAVSAGNLSAVSLAGTTLNASDVGLLVKDVAQAYLDAGVKFAANRVDVYGYRKNKWAERGGCVVSAVPAELNANLEDDSRLTRVDSLQPFATSWPQRGVEGPCWLR